MQDRHSLLELAAPGSLHPQTPQTKSWLSITFEGGPHGFSQQKLLLSASRRLLHGDQLNAILGLVFLRFHGSAGLTRLETPPNPLWKFKCHANYSSFPTNNALNQRSPPSMKLWSEGTCQGPLFLQSLPFHFVFTKVQFWLAATNARNRNLWCESHSKSVEFCVWMSSRVSCFVPLLIECVCNKDTKKVVLGFVQIDRCFLQLPANNFVGMAKNGCYTSTIKQLCLVHDHHTANDITWITSQPT